MGHPYFHFRVRWVARPPASKNLEFCFFDLPENETQFPPLRSG